MISNFPDTSHIENLSARWMLAEKVFSDKKEAQNVFKKVCNTVFDELKVPQVKLQSHMTSSRSRLRSQIRSKILDTIQTIFLYEVFQQCYSYFGENDAEEIMRELNENHKLSTPRYLNRINIPYAYLEDKIFDNTLATANFFIKPVIKKIIEKIWDPTRSQRVIKG